MLLILKYQAKVMASMNYYNSNRTNPGENQSFVRNASHNKIICLP